MTKETAPSRPDSKREGSSFTPPADLYQDLPTGDYTSVVEARHDRQQGFLAELRQQRTKAEDQGDQKAADLVSQTILDARDFFEQQNIDFYNKQRGVAASPSRNFILKNSLE